MGFIEEMPYLFFRKLQFPFFVGLHPHLRRQFECSDFNGLLETFFSDHEGRHGLVYFEGKSNTGHLDCEKSV